MNFILNNRKLGWIMLFISIISLLWINTFGLNYHMNEMRIDKNNNNCLFNSQTSGCTMSFSEHASIWHEMFTILPQNILEFITTLVLFIIFTLTFIFWRNYFYIFYRQIALKFKLYKREHPQINLFSYFKEVFSSGILNTKIYKLATI